jgi:hypothetical protein
MDAEQFVASIRSVVMHSAVDQVVTTLVDPPGRRPAPELVELSKWYLGLETRDREMVRRILVEASHAAVFGLFAVLDGVRRVDAAQPPGDLELWYEGREGRVKLSGDLHDLLNSEEWRR